MHSWILIYFALVLVGLIGATKRQPLLVTICIVLAWIAGAFFYRK